MKCSALNVDFNGVSFDPLGSRSPLYERMKFGYSFSATVVQSSKRTVPDTDTADLLRIITSRGLGVNFLPANGFKRGPPHCVERTFSYRYCRLKPSSSGVLLK